MKALRELRRFVLFKSAEGCHAEVRSYVLDHIDALASALRVSAESLVELLAAARDDELLAAHLLNRAIGAETLHRKTRETLRLARAQSSADEVGQTVQWREEAGRAAAHLALPALLSSALTRRQDVLVFVCDEFTVRVPQAALIDLARISRVRIELTAFVDATGLHVRWRTGELNLRSRPEPNKRNVARVVVALRPRAAAAA